jgi:chromosome partitioning protein
MNIIAIANQKGGVGKTTTAVNLSAALAKLGKKTLLIDLDPQGNATTAGGLSKDTLENSICEVIFDESTTKDAIFPISENLDIIGTNTNLVAAEIHLLDGKNNHKLQEVVEHVSYDFVIIDCPPSLNMLTINALSCAHYVIIPMQCEYYALEGLSSLIQTLSRVRSDNPQLEILGVVRTMFDGRNNLSNEVSSQLLEHFQDKVFKTLIPRNVALAEAPSFGKNIIEYNKSSRGSIAHLSLANEVIHRLRDK